MANKTTTIETKWVNAAGHGRLEGKRIRFASDHQSAHFVHGNQERTQVRYSAKGGGEWQGWFDNSSLEIVA